MKKRVETGIVVVLFLLLITPVIWFEMASRDSAPPDTSDLVPERAPVPDAENAYTYFCAATNSLYWPTNKTLVAEILDGTNRDDAFVQKLIARNEEALRQIKRGLSCGICQVPEVTGFDSPLPYLSPWRNIGRITALKARAEQEAGQYGEAAATCVDLLRFGQLIQTNAECLIGYLVGTAILQLGLEQSRQLAYATGPTEAQLLKLSEQIRQLGPFDCGLATGLKGEFRAAAAAIDDLARGKFLSGNEEGEIPKFLRRNRKIPGYIFQPNNTKKVFADFHRAMINKAPLSYRDIGPYDLPKELAVSSNRWVQLARPNAIGRILASLVLPAYAGVFEKTCRIECSASATRLILACRAYERTTHELPETLEALRPNYIEAVPRDPFDGKPFRYSKAKRIVYSAGRDLRDSGGSTELPADQKTRSRDQSRWSAPDIVFEVEPGIAPTNTPVTR